MCLTVTDRIRDLICPPNPQEIFGKGDKDRDGAMNSEEYLALHRAAEDDQGSYDQVDRSSHTCMLFP